MNGLRLAPKQYNLLTEIMDDVKLFDKHDNCFQMSNRQTATKLGVSSKTVDRLMSELKKTDTIRLVVDIFCVERWMLNPKFIWKHSVHEYHFAVAMYHLGSHEAAAQWRLDCMQIGYLIDPSTGEIMSRYDYQTAQTYVDKKNIFSRFKRRSVDITEVEVDNRFIEYKQKPITGKQMQDAIDWVLAKEEI